MINDTAKLEELLGVNPNLITLQPYSALSDFTQIVINRYCFKYGVSLIPTKDLVDWLVDVLPKNQLVVEFGAGAGSLYAHIRSRGVIITAVDPKYDTVIPNASRIHGIAKIKYHPQTVSRTAEDYIKSNTVYYSIVSFVPTKYTFPACTIDLDAVIKGTRIFTYLIIDEDAEPIVENLRVKYIVHDTGQKIIGRGHQKGLKMYMISRR